MKKKVLSIILVITLIMSFGMTAFADGATSDPAVQASLDAYGKIKTAMTNKDLGGLRAATAEFESSNLKLSEEQEAEVQTLLGEEMVGVIWDAATIVGMADAKDAFLANKNANTAKHYVDNYKLIVLDGEWGADIAALIQEMIPDGQAVYEEALGFLPGENVIKVNEAYQNLKVALEIQSYDDDFVTAYEGFEAVLDIFNELTEEEMAQLAALMEESSAEGAFGTILSDWITANVVHEMGQLYNAYAENPSEETAKAFIEYYDSLYNDPDYVDEELRADVEGFFFGIHESYKEAKALSAGGETSDGEGEVEEESVMEETDVEVEVEDENVAPKTGDEGSVILLLTCMIAASAVAVAAKRRRA